MPKNVVIRLDKAINSPGPRPASTWIKKLAGTDNDYRIRVGDYRIIYSIEDDRLIVLVVDVRPSEKHLTDRLHTKMNASYVMCVANEGK